MGAFAGPPGLRQDHGQLDLHREETAGKHREGDASWQEHIKAGSALRLAVNAIRLAQLAPRLLKKKKKTMGD
jgi:hypothetical protein